MNCISQICCFHVALISCLAIIRVYHIFVSISTCALREEGNRLLKAQKEGKLYISIHALREEGDQKGHTERRRQAISIHALREEGDIPESYTELDGSVFLSTPSARRATTGLRRCPNLPEDFYPRPPRGGRPIGKKCLHKFWVYFYPRPPRGGRPLATQLASCCCEFLSTPSARRATIPADKDGVRIAISIHALREEGDQGLPLNRTRFEIFLSTPSARRATELPA